VAVADRWNPALRPPRLAHCASPLSWKAIEIPEALTSLWDIQTLANRPQHWRLEAFMTDTKIIWLVDASQFFRRWRHGSSIATQLIWKIFWDDTLGSLTLWAPRKGMAGFPVDTFLYMPLHWLSLCCLWSNWVTLPSRRIASLPSSSFSTKSANCVNSAQMQKITTDSYLLAKTYWGVYVMKFWYRDASWWAIIGITQRHILAHITP